jgi:sugar phosphate isomerase/epimerase
MEIGLYAESTGLTSLDDVIRRMSSLGLQWIEIGTGGQADRPFLDLKQLLSSENARRELLEKLSANGLRLSALNASAFTMHPRVGGDHAQLVRDTMRLAGMIGLDRIIVQSGVPGDAAGAAIPNWVVYPWPPDTVDVVRRQWEAAITLWTELAETGRREGVTRLCFEMHPLNLVHNPPTLLHLREAVGPAIGANFDPSHLMWVGCDIPACVRMLEGAVYHVHIKDVRMMAGNLATVGVLDSRPWVGFRERPWTFCTPGFGHDALWWRQFFEALSDIGYDDVASIENEDPYLPGFAGVEKTVSFLRTVL